MIETGRTKGWRGGRERKTERERKRKRERELFCFLFCSWCSVYGKVPYLLYPWLSSIFYRIKDEEANKNDLTSLNLDEKYNELS